MKSGRWSAWEAQTPSTDFADRVVAAIVRDRTAGARTRTHRWAAVLVLAALLGSGGVWARAALRRWAVVQPALPSPAARASAPVRNPEPAWERAPATPPTEPPAIAPPLPRRATSSIPRALSVPDAGRKVRVPTCNCTQGICDCGEEP